MKYFLITVTIILSSCSANMNSKNWNDIQIKKSLEKKRLTKIYKKKDNYKAMSFIEFELFLKDYSDKTDFPEINN